MDNQNEYPFGQSKSQIIKDYCEKQNIPYVVIDSMTAVGEYLSKLNSTKVELTDYDKQLMKLYSIKVD